MRGKFVRRSPLRRKTAAAAGTLGFVGWLSSVAPRCGRCRAERVDIKGGVADSAAREFAPGDAGPRERRGR